LSALETLRRDAVEAAQRQLAEARAELAHHESRFTEASAARLRCEEALQGQRAHFSEARSVQHLRLAESALHGLTHELRLAETRLGAAEQACHQSRARVRDAERGLIEAEVGRRAVSKLLTTRRGVADKRREREDEDQADDLFRGRHRE
jgi:flagellar biosynthesis chaperone FliJ